MSTSKEDVLARLLKPDGLSQQNTKSSCLIQEVGAEVTVPEPAAVDSIKVDSNKAVEEGPSLLEMMMAAQRQAKAEKDKEKTTEAAVESKKSLGGGFKKGFFGSNSKPKPSTIVTPISTVKNASNKQDIIEVKKAQSVDKNTKSSSSPFVFEEVQKAMEEDKHPLLQDLKKNEWVTPDLMQAFQKNAILSRGFQSPKCMAAMELLQKDPQEARRRFQDDPEVAVFLQEFGKLMSGHFEALGTAQTPQNNNGTGSPQQQPSGAAGIQVLDGSSSRSNNSTGAGAAGLQSEIGPLHAQAIQRKSAASTATTTSTVAATAGGSSGRAVVAPSSSSTSTTHSSQKQQEEEQERVKQILQDEELRTMLMDAELQRILLECGDPALFQRHMQNPEIRKKIMRLQQAGLVGTAK